MRDNRSEQQHTLASAADICGPCVPDALLSVFSSNLPTQTHPPRRSTPSNISATINIYHTIYCAAIASSAAINYTPLTPLHARASPSAHRTSICQPAPVSYSHKEAPPSISLVSTNRASSYLTSNLLTPANAIPCPLPVPRHPRTAKAHSKGPFSEKPITTV